MIRKLPEERASQARLKRSLLVVHVTVIPTQEYLDSVVPVLGEMPQPTETATYLLDWVPSQEAIGDLLHENVGPRLNGFTLAPALEEHENLPGVVRVPNMAELICKLHLWLRELEC